MKIAIKAIFCVVRLQSRIEFIESVVFYFYNNVCVVRVLFTGFRSLFIISVYHDIIFS